MPMSHTLYMKTVKLTMDDDLLAAVDHAAGESQETRSVFIRAALNAELARRRNAALEEVHRQSYLAQPDDDAWHPTHRAWGE